MIGRDRLLALLQDALTGSPAGSTEIGVEAVHTGITRYAASQIHQTTELDDIRVWVRAVVGKSVGTAVGNSLLPGDMRALLEEATAVARIQEPNPYFESLPSPAPVGPIVGFDEQTATLPAALRAEAIGAVLERVAERGWTASGTYHSEGRELAVVNSLGVAAYAPSSLAFLRALPDSGEGTGYADALTFRAGDLDVEDVVRRALERCTQNRAQRDLPPGTYEAIFEDLAVAETLVHLANHGLGAQAYEEGRSFLSGRLGETVTGEHVTIWDDATDPRGLPVAADYEGVPKRRLSLIEGGVARGVAYDSFWAHRTGGASNGHGTPVEGSYYGPAPSNLFMEGGNATLEGMIRSTRRGLLVTRFHYTHCPDPRRVVMTGTTRDGTLLIEDGEIVGAVKNLRLTQSVPELYGGIELLGQPRLCRDWWSSNGMGRLSFVCPPMKVKGAVFTSGTRF